MQGPRERMVVSAALLIRERGAHATAISDVLQHSGAPRGSAYHYFPGGRTQLLCEAVDYAGEHVAAMINEAEGGLELLDALIDKYRQQLLSRLSRRLPDRRGLGGGGRRTRSRADGPGDRACSGGV